jgi:hypothetical protein
MRLRGANPPRAFKTNYCWPCGRPNPTHLQFDNPFATPDNRQRDPLDTLRE